MGRTATGPTRALRVKRGVFQRMSCQKAPLALLSIPVRLNAWLTGTVFGAVAAFADSLGNQQTRIRPGPGSYAVRGTCFRFGALSQCSGLFFLTRAVIWTVALFFVGMAAMEGGAAYGAAQPMQRAQLVQSAQLAQPALRLLYAANTEGAVLPCPS